MLAWMASGTPRTVGSNVRRWRLERDLTLKELGLLCNYAESTLSEIETGRIVPSGRRLPQIAKALRVGVEDLYEGVR